MHLGRRGVYLGRSKGRAVRTRCGVSMGVGLGALSGVDQSDACEQSEMARMMCVWMSCKQRCKQEASGSPLA